MEDEIKEENIKDGENKAKEPDAEELKKERDNYLAGWQRAQADFLNYKKEQNKRIEEVLKFANFDLIIRLLPILDNFDLIEKKFPEELRGDENIKGVLQIKTQILDFLKSQNLEVIKIVVDEKFDPNFHEAIEMVETGGKEPDIIVEEIQKGYMMYGRVIRPAKVKVTK